MVSSDASLRTAESGGRERGSVDGSVDGRLEGRDEGRLGDKDESRVEGSGIDWGRVEGSVEGSVGGNGNVIPSVNVDVFCVFCFCTGAAPAKSKEDAGKIDFAIKSFSASGCRLQSVFVAKTSFWWFAMNSVQQTSRRFDLISAAKLSVSMTLFGFKVSPIWSSQIWISLGNL